MSKKAGQKQATANPKQLQATPTAIVPQTHTLSTAERQAPGKEARQQTPRDAHAVWTPPPDRADPIDLLIANSEGRVPELVPIRYGRMLASPYAHPGQRVVAGQRLTQAASDMFLGWTTGSRIRQVPFYLRQRRDAKIKPVVEIMKPFNLHNYAQLCGNALARAYARSGDPVILSGYMGKSGVFAEAMANFAVAYADQNERDYAALVTAVRDGRIQAQMVE